ncbi:DUF2933 domain-containing protein [Nonomuraea guangzhouensis]|uniref:DUF2933 domain-containing protein n=1 Tax=Nonomuraea guangzhouensis TaxID=1291555 RepID=A0ABW4GUM1_9ACTN|nr:DUF2933 domain-containing protein [Nonomuraea guangzhouensis]
MMKQHLILAAVAAVAAIAAVWVGAPPSTVLLVVFLLGCPLMMLMMMRSMGGHDGDTQHDRQGEDHKRAGRS